MGFLGRALGAAPPQQWDIPDKDNGVPVGTSWALSPLVVVDV